MSMSHQEGSELDDELVAGVATDQDVKVSIKDALHWNEQIDASGIRVWVNESGSVTLAGYVSSEGEKKLAGDIASRTRGVTDVSNHLHVIGDATCE